MMEETPPLSSLHLYLKRTSSVFMPVAGSIMFLGCPSIRPILENAILHERQVENFFKLGTNIHLDSRMNWLDSGSQRSKVTVASQNNKWETWSFLIKDVLMNYIGQRSQGPHINLGKNVCTQCSVSSYSYCLILLYENGKVYCHNVVLVLIEVFYQVFRSLKYWHNKLHIYRFCCVILSCHSSAGFIY